jgi:hypothetical protein
MRCGCGTLEGGSCGFCFLCSENAQKIVHVALEGSDALYAFNPCHKSPTIAVLLSVESISLSRAEYGILDNNFGFFHRV